MIALARFRALAVERVGLALSSGKRFMGLMSSVSPEFSRIRMVSSLTSLTRRRRSCSFMYLISSSRAMQLVASKLWALRSFMTTTFKFGSSQTRRIWWWKSSAAPKKSSPST